MVHFSCQLSESSFTCVIERVAGKAGSHRCMTITCPSHQRLCNYSLPVNRHLLPPIRLFNFKHIISSARYTTATHKMDGDQSAKTMEKGANSAMNDTEMTSGIHETVKQTVRLQSVPTHPDRALTSSSPPLARRPLELAPACSRKMAR